MAGLLNVPGVPLRALHMGCDSRTRALQYLEREQKRPQSFAELVSRGSRWHFSRRWRFEAAAAFCWPVGTECDRKVNVIVGVVSRESLQAKPR